MHTDIDWGFNCLTSGIHHGRPEPIWNLPLFQSMIMFDVKELQALVVARIYQDAMQYVEHGLEPRMTQEWADAMAKFAEEDFTKVITTVMAEIQRHYSSPAQRNEMQDVIRWYKEGRLSAHFQPRHSHDSINLLCRILGQKCLYKARPEAFKGKEA